MSSCGHWPLISETVRILRAVFFAFLSITHCLYCEEEAVVLVGHSILFGFSVAKSLFTLVECAPGVGDVTGFCTAVALGKCVF